MRKYLSLSRKYTYARQSQRLPVEIYFGDHRVAGQREHAQRLHLSENLHNTAASIISCRSPPKYRQKTARKISKTKMATTNTGERGMSENP